MTIFAKHLLVKQAYFIDSTAICFMDANDVHHRCLCTILHVHGLARHEPFPLEVRTQ